MLGRITFILLPLATALVAGGASAMSMSPKSTVECRVIGGEDLPAASGGSAAFCAAIERAALQTPDLRFKVALKVKGPSFLTATLITAEGKTLPEQTFSISDRGLTRGSLERFANSLVAEVVRAASR